MEISNRGVWGLGRLLANDKYSRAKYGSVGGDNSGRWCIHLG